jgi:hypothetical protein
MTCLICGQSGKDHYCPAHQPYQSSSARRTPDPPTREIEPPVSAAIRRRCDAIRDLLVAKNLAYGNSAIEPVRIFSRASADEQLRVRIDDKLSRLAKGQPEAFGEDVVLDLIGYLVLLLVFRDASRV